MDDISRATLIEDLNALLGADRDDLDWLTLTQRGTSNGLIVMVRRARLQLIYPQAGWGDLIGAGRFWVFGLRNKLSPRFERWGKEPIHRAVLGNDARLASDWIDACFAAVFHTFGPFTLNFDRRGWAPASATSRDLVEPS